MLPCLALLPCLLQYRLLTSACSSVMCNVGVLKSTYGIEPKKKSIKQKLTDQKLNCFKNVLENSSLFLSERHVNYINVCIFLFYSFLLFIPFLFRHFVQCFFGVYTLFLINLFLYCWCQNLNYCGLNLFNKLKKKKSQPIVLSFFGIFSMFSGEDWQTFNLDTMSSGTKTLQQDLNCLSITWNNRT